MPTADEGRGSGRLQLLLLQCYGLDWGLGLGEQRVGGEGLCYFQAASNIVKGQ